MKSPAIELAPRLETIDTPAEIAISPEPVPAAHA